MDGLDYSALRRAFNGAYIANGGYTRERAIEAHWRGARRPYCLRSSLHRESGPCRALPAQRNPQRARSAPPFMAVVPRDTRTIQLGISQRRLTLSKGSLADGQGGSYRMDNRLLVFARLARAVAERVVPNRASRFAPRRYRQPQLLASASVKEHLGLDYRTAEEQIASDGLRVALGLTRVQDHTTLWCEEVATPRRAASRQRQKAKPVMSVTARRWHDALSARLRGVPACVGLAAGRYLQPLLPRCLRRSTIEPFDRARCS